MTLENRKRMSFIFMWVCRISCFIALAFLVFLLCSVFEKGLGVLSWDFFQNYPSRFPSKAGIKSALFGTIYIISLTCLIAIPIGVFTAIYLSEYADLSSKRVMFLRVNIDNLAGMPSIVYGLLGLAVFVRFFGLERSVLAGGLTMALLSLPVIIITSDTALRAVPDSIRHAGFALGARKWQVVFGQVLPAATPGIMTGIILSISRAIGETAPLILVGALSFVAFLPTSLKDPFTVLPVQVYNWASRPQESFQDISAAAIIVLLVVLIILNSLAIYIRNRYQRYRI